HPRGVQADAQREALRGPAPAHPPEPGRAAPAAHPADRAEEAAREDRPGQVDALPGRAAARAPARGAESGAQGAEAGRGAAAPPAGAREGGEERRSRRAQETAFREEGAVILSPAGDTRRHSKLRPHVRRSATFSTYDFSSHWWTSVPSPTLAQR